MDNLRGGTWREMDPRDVETEVLKKFLRRHKKVCPSDRAEIVRAVQAHLSSQNRRTLTVKTDQGAVASVINALGAIFAKKGRPENDQTNTNSAHKTDPVPRNQNFQNIRNYTSPNLSPIEPIQDLRIRNTVSPYSQDSLNPNTRSEGPQLTSIDTIRFPPPPSFVETQNENEGQANQAYSDSFLSDSIYEASRIDVNENFYASPEIQRDPRFSRNTDHKVTFRPSSPEDNLTQNLNPRAPFTQNFAQKLQPSANVQPNSTLQTHSGNKKFTQKFLYKFSSSKDDIADYLSAVERFADNMGLTEQEAIFLALQNFSIVAEANLCADSLDQTEKNSWILFKKALIKKFGLTVEDYWSKFESENRKESESASTFLSRLSVLYKKANNLTQLEIWHKKEIVRRFKNAINPRLKSHLDAISENSYDTIASKCQTLERAHKIPQGYSARVVNTVTYQDIRNVGSAKNAEKHENQDKKSPNFSRNAKFRKSSREGTPCAICGLSGHGLEICFFNPLGARFKGAAWVEAQLKKKSSKN